MSEESPEKLKFRIDLPYLLDIVNRIVTPQSGFLDNSQKMHIPSDDIFLAATAGLVSSGQGDASEMYGKIITALINDEDAEKRFRKNLSAVEINELRESFLTNTNEKYPLETNKTYKHIINDFIEENDVNSLYDVNEELRDLSKIKEDKAFLLNSFFTSYFHSEVYKKSTLNADQESSQVIILKTAIPKKKFLISTKDISSIERYDARLMRSIKSKFLDEYEDITEEELKLINKAKILKIDFEGVWGEIIKTYESAIDSPLLTVMRDEKFQGIPISTSLNELGKIGDKNAFQCGSFIVRSGERISSGHYVSVVKRLGHWYYINDKHAKRITKTPDNCYTFEEVLQKNDIDGYVVFIFLFNETAMRKLDFADDIPFKAPSAESKTNYDFLSNMTEWGDEMVPTTFENAGQHCYFISTINAMMIPYDGFPFIKQVSPKQVSADNMPESKAVDTDSDMSISSDSDTETAEGDIFDKYGFRIKTNSRIVYCRYFPPQTSNFKWKENNVFEPDEKKVFLYDALTPDEINILCEKKPPEILDWLTNIRDGIDDIKYIIITPQKEEDESRMKQIRNLIYSWRRKGIRMSNKQKPPALIIAYEFKPKITRYIFDHVRNPFDVEKLFKINVINVIPHENDNGVVLYKKVDDEYDEDLRQRSKNGESTEVGHFALMDYYILRWTEDIFPKKKLSKTNNK